MEEKREVKITINNKEYKMEVETDKTLASLLRDDMELLGTKTTCEVGECGACTVLIDGKAYNSCLVLVSEIDRCNITTIEGLADGDKLDPVQQAFIELDAVQCGHCTSGMIMAAKGLLNENSNPSDDEIRHAMAGNFCRCTGYNNIIKAVKKAAKN